MVKRYDKPLAKLKFTDISISDKLCIQYPLQSNSICAFNKTATFTSKKWGKMNKKEKVKDIYITPHANQ